MAALFYPQFLLLLHVKSRNLISHTQLFKSFTSSSSPLNRQSACKFYPLLFYPLSCVQLSATTWTAACQASLSFTISWNFLKFISIESMMPSNHLILCHPLLLLPSVFPSIMAFSSESYTYIPSYLDFLPI